MTVITPNSFFLSHTGKVYQACSGKRGGGAAAALNVELVSIGVTPGRDLFCKLWFGMDWQKLAGAQYGGLIVSIDDQTIIEIMSNMGAPGSTSVPVIYHEFVIPRNSKLLIEGRSDDTNNERYCILLGYPL